LAFLKRGKKKGEEGYGDGRVTISAGHDVLLDEEAMVEQLLACIEAPDYQPPTLPAVAVELMSLSGRADVEIDEVVDLFERDSLIDQRAGELMAGIWELPEDIQITLSNHHQVIRKGEIHLLSATVAIANEVAHSLGAGVIPKENDSLSEMTDSERDCVSAHTSVDKSSKATIKHAIDGLGLDPQTLLTIRKEAKELLATLPMGTG